MSLHPKKKSDMGKDWMQRRLDRSKKIHPEYHKYDVLEYADEIFSFAAARRAFVLMHPQHIPSMPAFADKYPDMKLIIAHLGSKEHVDAIVAAKNGYTTRIPFVASKEIKEKAKSVFF